MTFPQVIDADTTSGLQTANSSAWAATYPTNIAAGDLLFGFLGTDGNPGFVGGAFTLFATDSDLTSSVFAIYRVAVGNESGAVTLTLGANEQGCWRIIRIPAATWYGDPAFGVGLDSSNTSGSGTNPDPPPISPPWSTEDMLFFAVSASDHGNTTYTGFPTNYTNTSAQESGGANGAALGTARRENVTTLENPSVFTTDASEGWASLTIIVRPAARVPRSSPYPQILAH